MRELYLLGKYIACKAGVTTEGPAHLRTVTNRRHAAHEVRGFYCGLLYAETDARVSSSCAHRQCVTLMQCEVTRDRQIGTIAVYRVGIYVYTHLVGYAYHPHHVQDGNEHYQQYGRYAVVQEEAVYVLS